MIIIIVVLTLIATYLLATSGLFSTPNWLKKITNDIEDNTYIDNGMMGSPPSDDIDVYDSKKPIVIPMEGAINTLLDSFKNNANTVFIDFSANRNSRKYKEYIFDDYKLEILRRSGSLSEEQLNKYMTIRNTVVKDINNLFTYHLDKIKYNEDKSYFNIKREILNSSGTALILTFKEVDSITNYVLSSTDIPSDIIILIKYKLSITAQELLDQIIMLAGYNYTTVLEVLEHVLIKEPTPGVSILGVVNSPNTDTSKGVSTVRQGFWTQVYFAFKANNINNFLISLIKLSFMNEHNYRSILGNIVSNMHNAKFTEAMNNLVLNCKKSESNLIKLFPYNFTHALLSDAINENRIMLSLNKSINVNGIVSDTEVSNIEKYSNIEYNFPVAVQSLVVSNFNDGKEFDYHIPNYPVLSNEYLVNNYLSFPNIKHRGLYLDRTLDVPVNTSGYIMITNVSSVDMTISGFTVYATLQNGFITDDYRDISLTVTDDNIIYNSAIITVESGKFVNGAFNDASDLITTNWLTASNIVIPAGRSIRIRATKQVNVIGAKYLRVYAVLVTFAGVKPISDFLRISAISDTANIVDTRYNHYLFKNIPVDLPNILCTLDSVYSMTQTTSSLETFKILNDNISNNFSRIIVTGSTGSALNVSSLLNQPKSLLLTSTATSVLANTSSGIVSATGLITDTHAYSESNPNTNRSSYRIRLTNTSATATPIMISKIIVFGDVAATDTSFSKNTALGGFISDDNILLRNTVINVFTMNTSESAIDPTNVNKIVVDPNYQVIMPEDAFRLDAGKSLFIEPTVSQYISASNRFVCVRAIYLEFSGTNKEALSLSIIKLSTANKIATTDASMSSMWSSGSAFIVVNPINDTATTYSNFSVSPFSVLPDYRSKFISESYYNPLSEAIQKQYHNNYDVNIN